MIRWTRREQIRLWRRGTNDIRTHKQTKLITKTKTKSNGRRRKKERTNGRKEGTKK